MASVKNIINLNCNWLNHIRKYIPNFCIDEQLQKAMCFREKLDIYLKDTNSIKIKPIGTFHVSIENIGPEHQEFLVHASSSITTDGHIRGSNLVSLINGELFFLEEKRKEFVQIDDDFYEKNLHMSNTPNDYVIQVMNNFTNKNEENAFEISHDSYNIISDGCNILLMRYLAINNYDGILSFDFITIEGKITHCNYECVCAKPIEFHGMNLNVYKIKQVICQDGEILHEIESIFTKQGKILQFDWIHTSEMMEINVLLDPLTCNQDPIVIPLQGTWTEDMEIMSKYLDEKTCNIAKLEEYLKSHPQIKHLIADYIQSLLCRKPEDAIAFSMDHFKIFLQDSVPNNTSIKIHNLHGKNLSSEEQTNKNLK